jgi:hypothetical protein
VLLVFGIPLPKEPYMGCTRETIEHVSEVGQHVVVVFGIPSLPREPYIGCTRAMIEHIFVYWLK